MKEEEENIHLIKRVSKELGLTYRELGKKIGYTESNLRKSVSENRLSLPLQKAIELYLENIRLQQNKVEEKDKIDNIRTNLTVLLSKI